MNLRQQLAAKIAEAKAALEAGELEKGQTLRGEADQLVKAIETMDELEGLSKTVGTQPIMRPFLPGPGVVAQVAQPTDDEDKVSKAISILRFGAVDDPTDVVMREVYGGDYRQISFDQLRAFQAYMRRGTVSQALSKQLWGIDSVRKMSKDGLSVQEIKTTMVEGQDTLGGFAVPPQIASDTISRIPGLTAIRGGGATVVQTASSMIEWLQLTGGTSRYPTALRGVWGAETQTPAAKNLTFGLLQIPVQVYTYKVPMSVSLIEDASNLVDVFVQQVSQTLGIDEDEAFFIGDGASRPRGILPGSANAHVLTEVVSGSSSALTWAGVRSIRHGVSAQYRQNTSYIGNGATAGVIEGFTDGTGRPYVEFLEPGSTFLRGTWRESEAMPDIAGSAYPLIFGNLSGYAVVERLGMSIQRYNDSATGINIVEFHVRRRLGGNVIEPWKLCLQKVAAS